jgi:L-lactate dehydrogenase (cytochrome)
VRELLERAAAAGCTALFLTVDLPVRAEQHANVRNGLSLPFGLRWRDVPEYLTKLPWTIGALRGGVRIAGNLQGRIAGASDAGSLLKWTHAQFDPSVTWDDLDWLRQRWPARLVVKGILNPIDARRAAEHGADGIVVSNHGGRQLDGAPSTIAALPRIADAVAGDIEVLFDGGIRSGQDVAKALAAGATFCLLGRAYLYGLGADGAAGVRRCIEILRSELSATMKLLGAAKVSDLDRRMLFVERDGDVHAGQPAPLD